LLDLATSDFLCDCGIIVESFWSAFSDFDFRGLQTKQDFLRETGSFISKLQFTDTIRVKARVADAVIQSIDMLSEQLPVKCFALHFFYIILLVLRNIPLELLTPSLVIYSRPVLAECLLSRTFSRFKSMLGLEHVDNSNPDMRVEEEDNGEETILTISKYQDKVENRTIPRVLVLGASRASATRELHSMSSEQRLKALKNLSKGQIARDYVRLEGMEEYGYECYTLDNTHDSSVPDKHINVDYCSRNTQSEFHKMFPFLFSAMFMDYFNTPRSWLHERLPDFLKYFVSDAFDHHLDLNGQLFIPDKFNDRDSKSDRTDTTTKIQRFCEMKGLFYVQILPAECAWYVATGRLSDQLEKLGSGISNEGVCGTNEQLIFHLIARRIPKDLELKTKNNELVLYQNEMNTKSIFQGMLLKLWKDVNYSNYHEDRSGVAPVLGGCHFMDFKSCSLIATFIAMRVPWQILKSLYFIDIGCGSPVLQGYIRNIFMLLANRYPDCVNIDWDFKFCGIDLNSTIEGILTVLQNCSASTRRELHGDVNLFKGKLVVIFNENYIVYIKFMWL
jgi:hypothetical protein